MSTNEQQNSLYLRWTDDKNAVSLSVYNLTSRIKAVISITAEGNFNDRCTIFSYRTSGPFL